MKPAARHTPRFYCADLSHLGIRCPSVSRGGMFLWSFKGLSSRYLNWLVTLPMEEHRRKAGEFWRLVEESR